MFSDIMHGIMITMSPDCLLALCIGAMFGTVVGALPGLGTAVAITICIPFTLQMGNASAIALLLGVYATSIYGGSISAVLLNTPGTPQSACTGFEGYAMAKAGKAEKALFLLLFFYLMRYRDIRRMIPFALLGAGLTWLVFEKILGVVVPQPFWLGLF